jgi:hypothetical protein
MTVTDLLRVTAVLEGGTGLALLLWPAIPLELLFGHAYTRGLDPLVWRIAGTALLSVGMVCWSAATVGVVRAMLLYNALVIALLLYARMGLGLSGIALWPVLICHLLLAGLCISGLQH